VKAREQLILMLEEDSADSSAGSGSGAGDFPEGGEPALSGHDHPGRHSLGACSAQELPGTILKADTDREFSAKIDRQASATNSVLFLGLSSTKANKTVSFFVSFHRGATQSGILFLVSIARATARRIYHCRHAHYRAVRFARRMSGRAADASASKG